MIIWNLPDMCPACKCKEVYPVRPDIQIPKPGEMYFICADQTCQNIWKDKVLTSARIQLYFIHCQRAPMTTADGIAPGACDIFVAFATNKEDACKAVGVDGEKGGYTSVDVKDLDTILMGSNLVKRDPPS